MATLFQHNEINTIVHLLRTYYGETLFGQCETLFIPGINEAKLLNLRYLVKNTTSLTDVILGQAQIGSSEIFNVALKIWFDWPGQFNIHNGFVDLCEAIEPNPAGCTAPNLYKMLTILGFYDPKSSKSASDQYNAMVAKCGNYKNSTSLEYEASVYAYITENIIMRNICPGFIPLLGFSSCGITTILDAINRPEAAFGDASLARLKEKITSLASVFPRLDMKFLITGSATDMKFLHDFEKDDMYTIPIAASIIFQAFYALYVMDKYMIRHGDLHNDNIFVQTLPDPVTLTFNVNDLQISFSTRFILKIYDFDRAYVEALGENDKLDDYAQIGTGNYFRRNADFAQFLCETARQSQGLFSVGNVLGNLGLGAALTSLPALNSGRCTRIQLSAITLVKIRTLISTLSANVTVDEATRMYYVTFDWDKLDDYFTETERHDIHKVVTKHSPFYANVMKKLVCRLNESGTVMEICEGWRCSPFHDLIFNIASYFEDPIKFGLFKPLLPPPESGLQEMVYTYIPPSPSMITPPPRPIRYRP